MVKKTILTTVIGALSTILLLKIFIGVALVDLIMRFAIPFVDLTPREFAYIIMASLLTAVVSTLIAKGVIKFPKWGR